MPVFEVAAVALIFHFLVFLPVLSFFIIFFHPSFVILALISSTEFPFSVYKQKHTLPYNIRHKYHLPREMVQRSHTYWIQTNEVSFSNLSTVLPLGDSSRIAG